MAEKLAYEDSMNAKVALDEGETIVSILTHDFDGDLQDEQIIAYRNLDEQGSPIYLAYIRYDELLGGFKRVWNTSTIITRPGTVSLYTLDLLGDRSVSVIVTGINAAGEHTLTALRKNAQTPDSVNGDKDAPFTKIAEIRIDGSIAVQETERTQAYQRGLSRGNSFTITAYGKDSNSTNMLDQIEITYIYNPVMDLYERSSITRMPGTQVEQRRVQSLLNGDPEVFERFIDGFWYYYAGADGRPDTRQYIYFDLPSRELIFYGDESLQVFTWLNSSATRYGIYISSHNISITTLRRSLNIEFESFDSIRIKVFEEVRLKLGVNDSWDGSYRKVSSMASGLSDNALSVVPYLDASYNGSIGKLVFSKEGSYELYTQGTVFKGKYAFFVLDNCEILEMRPGSITGLSRETYLVSRQSGQNSQVELTLNRVRLGTKGIEELHEAAFSLIPAVNNTEGS
ncbi:MAG: pallilysin-related adhesin [Treponema sp.]|nr:pallilysin-related adhesin [Treponema sp.]